MKDLNVKLSTAREKAKELRIRGVELSDKLVKSDLNPEERTELQEIETGIGEQESIVNDCCRALKIGSFSDSISEIGLNEKEIRQYSVVKLLNYLVNPNKQSRDAALLEVEASEAVEAKRGLSPQGIYLPPEIEGRHITRAKRDLNVTTGSAGGHAVSTDLMPGIIELLRNRLALRQAGATIVDGLVGDVAFPKQTAAGTAYWISTEGGAPTEGQQTLGQITMTPKTIGAFTDYTRNLRLQSSVDVEAFVRNDLAQILAIGIDLAGLYGSGASGQPTGLDNTTNVGSVAHSTNNAPTWAEIVEMRSAVNQDNADVGSVASITDSTMVGTLMSTTKDSGSGQFIVGDAGNMLMGRPLIESNQVTDGDIWYGVWSQLIMGMWGNLDLMVDPYTASSTGTTRIIALQSVDFGVRYAEAFCKAT
jgi:HK97 family phage major capsid protein